LSPEAQARLIDKQRAATTYFRQKFPVAAGGQVRAATAAAYDTNWVWGNQQAQITYYYCGPATLAEALGQRNIWVDQNRAAQLTGTTTDGTAWSGRWMGYPSPYNTGYPMADAMNYMMNVYYYLPVGLPGNPTWNDTSTFQWDLTYDIDHGYPILGDAWEAPQGPHLNGHPGYLEIFHWFDIRGYQNWGGTTQYEDSVAGASSISWSAGVPAYSGLATGTITTIMGGRGYIW